MNAQEQIRTLFERALLEMKEQGAKLRVESTNQFPPSPRLRVSIRYITNRFGVSWNNKNYELVYENVLIFYKRVETRWVEIDDKYFFLNVCKTCNTPRKVTRALARMDAFTRWMVERVTGVQVARENIMHSQREWVSQIDSRIGGIELGGGNLTTKFDPDGPFSSWPQELRNDLRNRKLNAIKTVRELTGMGLKDAKDFVESAMEILVKNGENLVYNSPKKFQDWLR